VGREGGRRLLLRDHSVSHITMLDNDHDKPLALAAACCDCT